MSETATTSASYLTQEAYDRLKGELDQLSGEGRTEIAKKIEAARDEGDLKENGGYHAAKEEQGKMEARIRQLTQLLEHRRRSARPPRTTAPSAPAWSSPSTCSATRTSFLLGSREIAEGSDLEVYSEKSPLGARHHRQEGRRHRVLRGPQRQERCRSRSSRPRRTPAEPHPHPTKAASPAGEAAFVVSAAGSARPGPAPVSGWRSGGTAGWPAARRPAARPRPRSACRSPGAAAPTPSARGRRVGVGVAEQVARGLRHRRDRVPLGEGLQRRRAGCRAGTNVLATNVSGKMTMNAALLTTSGLGTSIPIHAMTHEIA